MQRKLQIIVLAKKPQCNGWIGVNLRLRNSESANEWNEKRMIDRKVYARRDGVLYMSIQSPPTMFIPRLLQVVEEQKKKKDKKRDEKKKKE